MRRHVYKARKEEPDKKTALCIRYNKMPHFTLCIKFDFRKSFSDTRKERDLESGNLSSTQTVKSHLPEPPCGAHTEVSTARGSSSECGLWAPLESPHQTANPDAGEDPPNEHIT